MLTSNSLKGDYPQEKGVTEELIYFPEVLVSVQAVELSEYIFVSQEI